MSDQVYFKQDAHSIVVHPGITMSLRPDIDLSSIAVTTWILSSHQPLCPIEHEAKESLNTDYLSRHGFREKHVFASALSAS